MTDASSKRLTVFLCLAFSMIVSYRFVHSFLSLEQGSFEIFVLGSVGVIFTAAYLIEGRKSPMNMLIGGLIFFLYLSASLMIGLSKTSGMGMVDYLIWFRGYMNGTARDGEGYLLLTILLSTAFITGAAFYFTFVRFRFIVLFTVGVWVFLFGSSKENEIDILFVFFLFVMLLCYGERTRRKAGSSSGILSILRPSYFASIGILAIVVIILAVAFPKPSSIPRNGWIDHKIVNTLHDLNISNVPPMLGEQNRKVNFLGITDLRKNCLLDGGAGPTDETVLFEVEADSPVYLKAQSWDRYDLNQWVLGNNYWVWEQSDSYFDSQKRLPLYNILSEKLGKEKLKDIFGDGYKRVLSAPSTTLKEKELRITWKKMSTSYLLHPPGTTMIDDHEEFGPVQFDFLGSCYPENRQRLNKGTRYSVRYLPKELGSGTRESEIVRFAKEGALKNEELLSLKELSNIRENLETIGVNQLSSFDVDSEYAYSLYTELPEGLSERIYSLASEITAGLQSNFDKAKAIERYFHESGFQYTLTPPPMPGDREFADFFLFESKQGYCTHFATAMVILARASGIPARFVAGYMMPAKPVRENIYEVRVKDAHAFPEIFLEGSGWTVFEPTVSSVDESSAKGLEGLFKEAGAKVTAVIKSVAGGFSTLLAGWAVYEICLLLGILFLVWVFALRVKGWLWKRRLNSLSYELRIQELYAKTLNVLKQTGAETKDSETPLKYAERLKQCEGPDIKKASEIFNAVYYGQQCVKQEDWETVKKDYQYVLLYSKMKLGALKYYMHLLVLGRI
ncbi:MAG: transglutaminase domain-containing protein [Clostridia bacterium]|nr:transglutaminase domain-containing protein [Clostridia bacterium]